MKAELTESNGKPVLTLIPGDKRDEDFCRSLTKPIQEKRVGIRTAGKRNNKIEVAQIAHGDPFYVGPPRIEYKIIYTLKIDAPQPLRKMLVQQLQSKGLVVPTTTQRNGREVTEFNFNGKLFALPISYFNQARLIQGDW